MVNYSNGKVYKIWSVLGDKIYIGSTTKEYLSQRMDCHRKSYKLHKSNRYGNNTSFILFDEYDVSNCKIELLEAKECNSKDELLQLEGKYIREMNCVNKVIPCRTQKEYREDNKEVIIKQRKEYRENNIEKIKEADKLKYQNNIEKIKERKREIIKCNCGSEIKKGDIAKHCKTNKHLSFVEEKEEINI